MSKKRKAENEEAGATPAEDDAAATEEESVPDDLRAEDSQKECGTADDAGDEADESAAIEEIPPASGEEPERAEDAAEGAAAVESPEEQPLRITSPAQAKAIAEALLFVAGEPVSVRRLSRAMGGMNASDVQGVLAQLAEDYEREARGLQVLEVAGGFQLGTRPEYADWILQFTGQKRRSPLTSAALETLAIVAYKQPVTRAEVDAIRGVESGGVVRTLLDLELIEVKGRKEVLGKPQLYGTSEKFLRAFGLRRLEDLPSIQELRERYQIGQRS